MAGGVKEHIRLPNLKQFKSCLGSFALVFGFGLLDKPLGISPFFSLGLTAGSMISIVIRGSRETRLWDLLGCIFGFAVLDLVAGWTRPLIGVQIISVSVITLFVFWRQWAEIPDNTQES
jgi:hypothetical protein